MIEIYTDGSARKGGAEGGYGVVVIDGSRIIKNSSVQKATTTNNEMELSAIIDALEYAIYNNLDTNSYIIYSDSAYCVNMYNIWIDNWYNNGWKKYDKKEIKNLDLVKKIFELKHRGFLTPIVKKTDGHCGIVGNELADALATNDLKKFERLALINKLEIL